MSETSFSLDAMLRKVQSMIARADHPNTPPAEADTARNMAEGLMLKYRIDSAMLEASGQGPKQTVVPVWRKFRVCDSQSEFSLFYRLMAQDCLRHVDCEFVTRIGSAWEVDESLNGTMEGNVGVYYVEAVGYEADLRIAEVLYLSAQVAFQKRLEPKYDPELSDQVNAYLMRSAGMEGWRIAEAIFGRTDKALRPKVRAMFKKEAEARGEDPNVLLGKGNSVKVFRDSFAEGFSSTIHSRLVQMRAAQADADKGALVLADRAVNVREAYYLRFPDRRPVTGPKSYHQEPSAGCPKCAKSKSGHCRDHPKPRAVRYSERSFNHSAYARGGNAAKEADLGGSSGGTRVTNPIKGEI